MDPRDLRPASYRGVGFLVTSTSLAGGRKSVKKTFVNSDLQVVEDLGLLPREFTLNGIVAARLDNSGNVILSYQERRDALIEALERGGPGTLIHPFLGRIEDLSVLTFNLTEDLTGVGEATISITFAPSESDGRPAPTETSITAVSGGAEAVEGAILSDVEERFEVTPGHAGNFSDALSKIREVSDTARSVVRVISALEDALDPFAAAADEIEETAPSLATSPSDLGSSVVSLVRSIEGLYEAPEDVLSTFSRLFDFGAGDVPFDLTTAGRIERQRNRDVLNSAIRAQSLARAYVAAASIDFQSVDEIDDVAENLEAQHQAVLDSGAAGDGVEESLAELRVAAGEFFDEQRDVRPRVVEVRTELTSARLLAYRHYGSSELGPAIASLNGVDDPAFVEGTVKVLTA